MEGTEITEKTLWKSKLHVLGVGACPERSRRVVNDFRRNREFPFSLQRPRSILLSQLRRVDRPSSRTGPKIGDPVRGGHLGIGTAGVISSIRYRLESHTSPLGFHPRAISGHAHACQ